MGGGNDAVLNLNKTAVPSPFSFLFFSEMHPNQVAVIDSSGSLSNEQVRLRSHFVHVEEAIKFITNFSSQYNVKSKDNVVKLLVDKKSLLNDVQIALMMAEKFLGNKVSDVELSLLSDEDGDCSLRLSIFLDESINVSETVELEDQYSEALEERIESKYIQVDFV